MGKYSAASQGLFNIEIMNVHIKQLFRRIISTYIIFTREIEFVLNRKFFQTVCKLEQSSLLKQREVFRLNKNRGLQANK